MAVLEVEQRKRKRDEAENLLHEDPWICILCREGVASQASQLEEATFAWPSCGHDMHAKCLWHYLLSTVKMEDQMRPHRFAVKFLRQEWPCPHCRAHGQDKHHVWTLVRMPRSVVKERTSAKACHQRVCTLLDLKDHHHEATKETKREEIPFNCNDDEQASDLASTLCLLNVALPCPVACGCLNIMDWDRFDSDELNVFTLIERCLRTHEDKCPVLQARTRVSLAIEECMKKLSAEELIKVAQHLQGVTGN